MQYGPIDVFRVGTWTGMSGQPMTITPDDLNELADGYDPKSAPAPAVIGHPTGDAPAYAWVEHLYVEGDTLKAMLVEAAAEFVEWVRAGRYRKVSISLYSKDAPNNPKPGSLYVRHIGFLGGMAPAVAGLEPVSFAHDAKTALTFDFEDGSIASERAAMRREREELAIEKLIGQGRVLPCHKAEILDFAGSLDGETTFAFSEGKRETPRAWFFDFLGKLPVQVPFGELPKEPARGGAGSYRGNLPAGHAVDAEGEILFTQASALMNRDNITFSEAVQRLARDQ